MKLEQGDPFEKAQAEWLRANLPGNRGLGYEKVWQDFIGNNGMSVPLGLDALDEKTQALRQKFVEGHYSMALAAFLFDQVARRMAAIEGKRTTVEEYLRDIDNYSSFINHLGGVCDMMGHMDEALKARDAIHDPVLEFHHLRSNAIHASRIPMQQDYADLRIPIICRTKDPQPGQWHEKTTWDKVDLRTNFVYLSDFAKETRDGLFKALNRAYPDIHRHADQLVNRQRVALPPSWPPPSSPPPSPAFSFTPPPSGFRG